ncbi:Glycerol-3-phosphate dehydrogenase [Gulosibacter molinativorax]|nr:glycerol-3-phosphate dehydrogenase/oxidase [Gulosibacter molinativorax]QUY62849.1 Glycerol-3-phosphate dehydrogenase [Gulosibacter molinativorax]
MNCATRAAAILRMKRSADDGRALDLLVIGGGVTGAGIALDAASRGLETAIVEAQDWASGTSSRSSKLVHGGLRYLEMLDFKLVHEALTERDLLLTTLAPHLVRPVAFLHPLIRPLIDRVYFGTGIALYDVLATLRPRPRAVPWHRHVSPRELGTVFRGIKRDAAVGAIQYWDAKVDDARFVTTLARTAVGHGAHAATRVRVVGLRKDAQGRVDGATLVDLETGEQFDVRAKTVISATGVWTEKTQSLATDGGLQVLASKGIHIVVPKDRIEGGRGLILRTATSVLFVIPWSRYWIIGTTDTPWREDLAHPVPNSRDIDYLLGEVNPALRVPLTREDIVGSWAGLRPLLQPRIKPGTRSAKVSREHTVAAPAPGFVSIAGGKLTTYRVMAKDAVDFVLGSVARRRPSRTHSLPLVGARRLDDAVKDAMTLTSRLGLDSSFAAHLGRRYGADVAEIAALCEADPALARPLEHAPAYLRAEIVFAIRAEGALHLDDLIDRRTRISFEYPDLGAAAVDEIADLATSELGWSAEERDTEVSAYLASTEAYTLATSQPDDAAAAVARTSC